MAATTMDQVFREFRRVGMSEDVAEIMAKVASQRDEVVTRADREAEREATRAGREAERKADREAFADKSEVAVLQTKAENTDSAIERIDQTLLRMDERFERIDATLAGMQEMIARLDEQMKALHRQNKVFIIPLSFVTLGALFGVIGLLIRLLMVQGP